MKGTVSWSDIEQELQGYAFPDKGNETVVFGAGFLGRAITPLLLKEDLQIAAFSDNDSQKWNTNVLDLPCIAPNEIKKREKPFALVGSIKYYAGIAEQLSALGVPFCTADAYVAQKHLPRFYEAYRLMDEDSRDIYARILLCRIRGDKREIREFCTDSQYFSLPEFRFCGDSEVFVDCGAYTGENVQTFISNVAGLFRKIYAFEPNPAALEAMKRRLAYQRDLWLFRDEQIVIEQAIVAKEGGVETPFYINQSNTANASTQNNAGSVEWVKTVSLDQYFKEEHITFLKADIEGSEWDMLLGGEKTIRTNRPKIAISLYHNVYDFFRIPLLLKEWVPEYRFAVRHHWNNFDETVLYCYT